MPALAYARENLISDWKVSATRRANDVRRSMLRLILIRARKFCHRVLLSDIAIETPLIARGYRLFVRVERHTVCPVEHTHGDMGNAICKLINKRVDRQRRHVRIQ